MVQNGKSVDLESQNQIDPINASVDVIVEYLIGLFREKQCQVSTIKGYRSIISNTLKFKSGYAIASHLIIILNWFNLFETQRPVENLLLLSGVCHLFFHIYARPYLSHCTRVGWTSDSMMVST